MYGYQCALTGSRVPFYATLKVVDACNDIFQSYPFEFIGISRIKALAIVFKRCRNTLVIFDDRDVKIISARMFDYVVHAFLYYTI